MCRFSVIPLDDFNYSFGQLTLLQQMVLGIPVIAADVPALRDYISRKGGLFRKQGYTSKKVEIVNNVWIGTSSIILPGVKIVNNVVVVAGSIVTKSIEDNVTFIQKRQNIILN